MNNKQHTTLLSCIRYLRTFIIEVPPSQLSSQCITIHGICIIIVDWCRQHPMHYQGRYLKSNEMVIMNTKYTCYSYYIAILLWNVFALHVGIVPWAWKYRYSICHKYILVPKWLSIASWIFWIKWQMLINLVDSMLQANSIEPGHKILIDSLTNVIILNDTNKFYLIIISIIY